LKIGQKLGLFHLCELESWKLECTFIFDHLEKLLGFKYTGSEWEEQVFKKISEFFKEKVKQTHMLFQILRNIQYFELANKAIAKKVKSIPEKTLINFLIFKTLVSRSWRLVIGQQKNKYNQSKPKIIVEKDTKMHENR
jgi:hypothetical protein